MITVLFGSWFKAIHSNLLRDNYEERIGLYGAVNNTQAVKQPGATWWADRLCLGETINSLFFLCNGW